MAAFTLDTELAEKEQHVMELMKQAAKILGLPMDDFDNDMSIISFVS
jgi:hypothetical protein